MNSETKTLNTETIVETRDVWVKPEIASFEAVTATQAATMNAGDGNNNNS